MTHCDTLQLSHKISNIFVPLLVCLGGGCWVFWRDTLKFCFILEVDCKEKEWKQWNRDMSGIRLHNVKFAKNIFFKSHNKIVSGI